MAVKSGPAWLPRRVRILVSWFRNVDRAVWAGAAVSLVAGILLFLFPYLFPMREFKHWYIRQTGDWIYGNPLLVVRYFGGLPGGYVAARYLADWRWEHRILAGVQAATLAVIAVFLLFVAYNVGSALAAGVSPPVAYILVASLLFAVGLVPMYALGGLLGAAAGHLLREYR